MPSASPQTIVNPQRKKRLDQEVTSVRGPRTASPRLGAIFFPEGDVREHGPVSGPPGGFITEVPANPGAHGTPGAGFSIGNPDVSQSGGLPQSFEQTFAGLEAMARAPGVIPGREASRRGENRSFTTDRRDGLSAVSDVEPAAGGRQQGNAGFFSVGGPVGQVDKAPGFQDVEPGFEFDSRFDFTTGMPGVEAVEGYSTVGPPADFESGRLASAGPGYFSGFEGRNTLGSIISDALSVERSKQTTSEKGGLGSPDSGSGADTVICTTMLQLNDVDRWTVALARSWAVTHWSRDTHEGYLAWATPIAERMTRRSPWGYLTRRIVGACARRYFECMHGVWSVRGTLIVGAVCSLSWLAGQAIKGKRAWSGKLSF